MFAWYSLVGTAGTALGQLIWGGLISSLQSLHGWAFVPSCRIAFFIYAAIGVIKLLLTLTLSSKVEATPAEDRPGQQRGESRPLLAESTFVEQESEVLSKKSFWSSLDQGLTSLVLRLFVLFGLDSFASGLASL